MKKEGFLLITIIALLTINTQHTYAAFPIANHKTASVVAANATTHTQSNNNKRIHFSHKLSEVEIIGLGILGFLSLLFGALGLIFGALAYSAAIGFGLIAIILGAFGLYFRSNTMMATIGLILGAVALILGLVLA